MRFPSKSPNRLRHAARAWLLVCALAFTANAQQSVFAFLFDGNDSRPAATTETREGRLRIFEEVWETVRARYYDPALRGLDWEALGAKYRTTAAEAHGQEEFYGVLRRLLGHLADPHTRVFAPGESVDWRETRFITVGLSLRELAGEVIVERVEPGSEAERAGVRAGDTLTSVGGEPAASILARRLAEQFPVLLSARPTRAPGVRLRVVARLFDGPSDSFVAATFRGHEGREKHVRLRRQVSTHAPALSVRRDDGRAVVSFNLFTAEIASELVRALKGELKDARGIVIDLRDNAGGEVEAMTDIASLFLAPGRSLGRFDDRAGRTQIDPYTRTALRSTADAPERFEGPLVVLVSARTASAAEVFTAALKESGRASAIIGETTCGCVLAIRRRHALADGGTLDISELDYHTANGTRLEGAGVEPGLAILPTRHSLRAGRDTAMERAIKILKASKKSFNQPRSGGRK
jgi:carboxyl-terminal processing protease